MFQKLSRRSLLKTTATTGAMLGLGDLGFLSRLGAVSAAEAKLDPNVVRLDPAIEPLVHADRKDAARSAAGRGRRPNSKGPELPRGAGRAAAGRRAERPAAAARRLQVPRRAGRELGPPRQPGLAGRAPLAADLLALDHFKGAQAQDVEERGDWTMSAVDEAAVPPAHKAKAAFIEAMDNWDEAAADAAVAGLARTAGANEIFELFFRYGMRDFRDIGHKAIYVANSWRTLQLHRLAARRAGAALAGLRPARPRGRQPGQARRRGRPPLPPQSGAREEDSPTTGRTASSISGHDRDAADAPHGLERRRLRRRSSSCSTAASRRNRSWDALHVASGELLMRQPGIVALHAVTTTNALHFAYQTSGNDETRRLLLLQNAAFLTMFRDAMKARGKVNDVTIDELDAGEAANRATKAVDQILADARQRTRWRPRASCWAT